MLQNRLKKILNHYLTPTHSADSKSDIIYTKQPLFLLKNQTYFTLSSILIILITFHLTEK